ncbi:MAG: tRNA (guanosine(46)-N7)-methyltransferase TrmB [bacterium]|nr:tRNA (guanosine(46)-N7)-methyltransferase TrmB [bacterium]
MRLEVVFAVGERESTLSGLPRPLDLDALVAGGGPWEVELGFGKGRYLLKRALEHPERRILGIELVSKYHRLLRRRARRHGLSNLLAVRGEALYLLSAVLPTGFAATVHVYFPDPWPKSRHHKRRLFDPETVDLVVGALAPGGELLFATDHLAYGELVCEILQGFPGLTVEPRAQPWDDGARTNYEAKYMREGRPILRLRALLAEDAVPGGLHPRGRPGILAAAAPRSETE